MTHELKDIVNAYIAARAQNLDCVLATVVALDGSSYRRPGVRMLLMANGKMVGAVSGGCVEKEIWVQANTVFKENIPKIMTYDGRYRLGCEGLLYILLEPFGPSILFLNAFSKTIATRKPIDVCCYFHKDVGNHKGLGTALCLEEQWLPVCKDMHLDDTLLQFKETMEPCLHLFIIGAEHDAVVLSSMASQLGWEVSVVATPTEEKSAALFSKHINLQQVPPEQFNANQIDDRTVVVLMTHSYVKDLQFLIAMGTSMPRYIGILGPIKRREKLLNEFIERYPETNPLFLEQIHGPAGLNIGAETPQEIAIAVLAEILTVLRSKEPMHLRDKEDGIHI